MTIATVGDLRRALEDLPDYAEVGVRITVGGDLVTDDVPLLEVEHTTDTAGHIVTLVPAGDPYNVRQLIDLGLAARDAVQLYESTAPTGEVRP